MWHPLINDEIEAMFGNMSGCYATSDLCGAGAPLLDHGSRLVVMHQEEQANPEWRAWLSRNRERARQQRMKNDPKYAAKRKRQLKASQERRRKRLMKGRTKRAYTCGRCGERGHSVRSCTAEGK